MGILIILLNPINTLQYFNFEWYFYSVKVADKLFKKNTILSKNLSAWKSNLMPPGLQTKEEEYI